MNKKILSKMIFGASLLLLAACTNDEPMDDNTLPEGKYPLEIASVTMSVKSSEQPWSASAPQTRVTENEDGYSSVWEWDGTEQIGVQIGDGKTGTYVLNEGNTITAENACYWASTATGQTVKAWFPATDEPISLADQSEGLAYVLQATETADFDKTVTLGFAHQLAKVRVLLDGTQAAQAETAEVRGYTSCTHTAGVVSTEGAEQDWLKMKRTTYADGTECWEANVVPGTITLNNFIRLNGMTVVSNLSGIPETLEGGKMYTVDLTVGEPIIDITSENCNNINGNGNYRVSGEFKHNITITGGSPTLYLENANISVGSGNAISITGGTPTIHVNGNNTGTSGDGAGIYVASGYTVTITGSSREDKLTVSGGNSGCGIGGYLISQANGVACGDITIRNVTVTSYGSKTDFGDMAAGIGSTSGASCGAIIIENATVHAYGKGLSSYDATPPAIGCGITAVGSPKSSPVVKISDNSEIHAHRGGSVGKTDYIGWAGIVIYANNAINLGGGTCTSSTVYCYTGESETPDKTVEYDENGEEKEL